MDDVKILSYQEIWILAEETSKKSALSKTNIYASIKSIIEDYEKLDKIPVPDIQKILKTKKLGELLFKAAELSRIDDVNVFAALKQEIDLNQR